MRSVFIYLAAGWVLWCCSHSLLIAKRVKLYITGWFAAKGRPGLRYRLFYTIVSGVTLLPLMVLTWLFRGEVVFVWQGGWHLLQTALTIGALWLFHSGSRQYDLHEMLFGQEPGEELAEIRFSRDGVHGIVRHPWYLGSLMFLWAWPVYHEATALAAVILSGYLFVGTLIEERRLVGEYGRNYQLYQQEVSMLFPWKWVVKNVSKLFTGHGR